MGLMYKLLGRGKSELSVEGFAIRWRNVIDSILPIDVILRSSGLAGLAQSLVNFDIYGQSDIYEESKEIEGIGAYRNHLLHRWQVAHNDISSFRFSRLSDIHSQTMKASKAYGETLVNCIEFKELLVESHRSNNPSLERATEKKSRDGTQWDVLTQECIESLRVSLGKLERQDHVLFSGLMDGKEINSRFHAPLHSQIPIEARNIDAMYGARPGFIANFTWV
ncbi:hypothetical protein M1N56_05375 [Dehalococcoidia bacterium]|nr:hypothetical protein [Dehalococcoidia bacterium]